MKLQFLMCLTLFPLFSFSQEISYKEVLIDSSEVKLDSFLIVGVGSSVTRVFLENLNEKLKSKLASKNISSSYSYLGKTVAEAKIEFAKIQLSNYKTVLLLLPDSASFFGIEYRDYGSSGGPVAFSLIKESVTYRQKLSFELYVNEQKLKQIWAASVEIECDPGKTNAAKKVSNKLLNSLKTNRLIQ